VPVEELEWGPAVEVCASKEAHLKLWKAAKVTVPKAFSLLPVQRLQSRLVQFEGTALGSFFTDWLPGKMDRLAEADGAFEAGRYEEADAGLAAAMKPIRACFDEGNRLDTAVDNARNRYQAHRKKHGYPHATCDDPDATCDDQATPMSQPAEVHRQTAELDRTLDSAKEALAVHRDLETAIFAQLVDVRKFKGKKNAEVWIPVSIRTNGVKLCVTFASVTRIKTPNIDALASKGYAWTKPARVDATTAVTGIYLDKEGRHDLKVPKGSAEVELVAINPGVVVPVQAATVPLSQCQDSAKLAAYLATNKRAFFSVNRAKWDKKSGRTEGVAREAQARATDPEYEAYCKPDDPGRKKTANLASFRTYLKATLEQAELLISRLLNPMRAVHRWREARTRMRALARLADKIWSTRAVDNRRHRAASRASVAEGVAPPVKLKRIVALGDGMFSGGFPKKPFARELAMRGPTPIISEFYTSKMCPCGTCKLEDVPNAGRPQPLDASRRPRRHIGHRGSINLCCAIQPFLDLGRETDRDELACMNILLCMANGLAPRSSRPSHLRQPAGWQRTDALMDT